MGITEDSARRDLASWIDAPYFGMIDIGTWQWLRPIFGLPEEGITYADYIYEGDINNKMIRHTDTGYPYFSGRCIGESLEGIFKIDSGASCCWVKNEWFIAVDVDLTRGVICYNSSDYNAALAERAELECYPLWPLNTSENFDKHPSSTEA